MKKYFLILVSIYSLLFVQLSAEPASTQMYANEIVIEEAEQYAFIGITGSYVDPLDERGVFGFRMGMQNNVWRTIFTYESNFNEYQAFLIEADRTVVAGLMGGKGRIYLGVSGGWLRYGADIVVASDDANTTDPVTPESFNGEQNPDLVIYQASNGYAYGGNIGFMYYLSDQVDISIEYRYLIVDKINLFDHIQGPSVSLHYFF